ncbi:DUF5107 domain-containing protein [Streptomyces sp. HNM0663]|uniref:DUF5107 domain-containing protein n=1 Tax=Streptomyces chengmaiensis TaxID=3040919 RepID=A0ABT6HZ83_9ACTN|nr:DUF5107 domain-containing protein [Streptomyces chengmaiensis]MDH2394033.1 DUF5107 domain-containing protein [Streptomyces chengmaiensis]
MSELRITEVTMPTADLGPDNPLPPLFSSLDTHDVADPGDADPEMRRNIAYGRVRHVLPYLIQDGYSRELTPQPHRAAVLENEYLRATFLLNSGGRLWSLVHKPTGQDLVYANTVFQPANLALRDAWVAGGVEWNFGTIGHSTTTSSPVHAVEARHPDGTVVLRMYEFERIRRAVFQIDAWLPEDSEVLFVHVKIVNPNSEDIPVYWWSNIAVPQRPDTRVLAPADAAWQFSYDRSIRRVPIPQHDGVDRTYPSRADAAADYFFDLNLNRRPWIAALNGDGAGLAQASTRQLRGRKLFVWGQHRGGRRWQEWLSPSGASYLEIQAGLARTQLEHLPLPAGTTWSWLEAYGRVTADPVAVHGDDWDAARAAAEDAVDLLVSADRMAAEAKSARDWADGAPNAVLHIGTGWGALERHLRSCTGGSPIELLATPFLDSSLGTEQESWLALLYQGRLPASDTAPVSYQTDPAWGPLLKESGGWLADLHLGVLKAANGKLDKASLVWTQSVLMRPTSWAWRNIGMLAVHDAEWKLAATCYRHAYTLSPRSLPLLHELVEVLLKAGQARAALGYIDAWCAKNESDGRLQLLEARAALEDGLLDRCRALLEDGIEVPNLREGDTSLSDLWNDCQRALTMSSQADGEALPVPERYDFVMKPDIR